MINSAPDKPKQRNKVITSIRIDADVIEHFRSGGPKYQTRINSVLREYVENRTMISPADRLKRVTNEIVRAVSELQGEIT